MTLEKHLPVREDADLEGQPQSDLSVIGLNGGRFPEVIGALSAETAREILKALFESPRNPAEMQTK